MKHTHLYTQEEYCLFFLVCGDDDTDTVTYFDGFNMDVRVKMTTMTFYASTHKVC